MLEGRGVMYRIKGPGVEGGGRVAKFTSTGKCQDTGKEVEKVTLRGFSRAPKGLVTKVTFL
jgi:hypothetical protein